MMVVSGHVGVQDVHHPAACVRVGVQNVHHPAACVRVRAAFSGPPLNGHWPSGADCVDDTDTRC